jgi:hypothetical protein
MCATYPARQGARAPTCSRERGREGVRRAHFPAEVLRATEQETARRMDEFLDVASHEV